MAHRLPDEPLDKQTQPGEFRLLRVYYRAFRFRDWTPSTRAFHDRTCIACLTYEARFVFETAIDNYREIFLSVPSSSAEAFLKWSHTDFVQGMKETFPTKWAAHEFAAELMDSDLILHVTFKLPWWKSVDTPPFSICPWGFVRPNHTHSLQPAFACGAKRLLSFLLDETDSPLGAQAREELRSRMGTDPAVAPNDDRLLKAT